MFIRWLHVVALAACVCCAPTVRGGAGGSDSNVITQQEISAAQVLNAYEAVNRLRPGFLRSRGQTSITSSGKAYPNVYLDGQPYGDLNSLRSITVSGIREIRYWSGVDAVTRFGMNNGAGVIEVITK